MATSMLQERVRPCGTCSMNIYVWRAYDFRKYIDDLVDEVELARNVI